MVSPTAVAGAPHRLATAPGQSADGDTPVIVLDNPGDDPGCVSELGRRHDLDRGVVVCLPRPGAGPGAVLAEDLLVALGKLPGCLAAEGLSRRGPDLAELWLAAEQVRELVVLHADRLPAPCWGELARVAAAAQSRLWLVAHRTPAAAHRAALAAGTTTAWPWSSALATLPSPTIGTAEGDDPDYGFPAVPDVEFPLFRAAARRLLAPDAFARVDGVYCATYTRARTHAPTLRSPRTAGATAADRVESVLQQLTIDATNVDEVLTRVRAAQAGLFAEGLFLDLAPRPSPTWGLSTIRLEPRLDHPTVTRLRGLAHPTVAAAVTLTRATGLSPAGLRALRRGDLQDDADGLRVVTSGTTYRIPARAAGPVRAALHQRAGAIRTRPATGASDDGHTEHAALLLTDQRQPFTERVLQTLRDRGADRAGIGLPARSFPGRAVADLRDPAGPRP